ncbi:MAG: hypothetical protein AB1499_03410 [Nitrospirota bacterium]
MEKDSTACLGAGILFNYMSGNINFTFEKFNNIGIFNLTGDLTSEHEDDLKLLLMRAIHGMDRAVLNLKKVTSIDWTCRQLLRKAYCTSLRLKSPMIIMDVPARYMTEIYECDISDTAETRWSPDYQESTI